MFSARRPVDEDKNNIISEDDDLYIEDPEGNMDSEENETEDDTEENDSDMDDHDFDEENQIDGLQNEENDSDMDDHDFDEENQSEDGMEENDFDEDDEDDEELLDRIMTEDIDIKGGDEKYSDFFKDPVLKKGSKSKFELTQEKLQAEMDLLEEHMMDPKPWHLRGEIEAEDRPTNAALEEDLDIRYTGINKPIVSDERELELTEIIKAKIKARDFDDVERRFKAQITSGTPKVQLNMEKPKGLAEEYEEEYFRKTHIMHEKQEDPVKEDIRKSMAALFQKLDAVASLHYVPRSAEEWKVAMQSTGPVMAIRQEVRREKAHKPTEEELAFHAFHTNRQARSAKRLHGKRPKKALAAAEQRLSFK